MQPIPPVSPEYMVLHGRSSSWRRRRIPSWARWILWGFIAFVGVNLVFVFLELTLLGVSPTSCWQTGCVFIFHRFAPFGL